VPAGSIKDTSEDSSEKCRIGRQKATKAPHPAVTSAGWGAFVMESPAQAGYKQLPGQGSSAAGRRGHIRR